MLNCYLFLGTPFDTPCGISNAGSLTDLKKPENHTPNSGVETPDETQLYALEGTPGCFSRTDSVENLDEHIEKGQKEAAEGPSEKVSSDLEISLDQEQQKKSQIEHNLVEPDSGKKVVTFTHPSPGLETSRLWMIMPGHLW